jgi:hypothetical protein
MMRHAMMLLLAWLAVVSPLCIGVAGGAVSSAVRIAPSQQQLQLSQSRFDAHWAGPSPLLFGELDEEEVLGLDEVRRAQLQPAAVPELTR